MIFLFRIVSDEVDNFKREIQIGYDKNQMCSFFLCDNNWEKEREITLEDMGFDSDQDAWLMDDTILSDYVDDGQRLLFVFDYMTDRAFFIEMKQTITGKTLKDPVCTSSMGTPPPQNIDLDEFEAKADAKAAAVADDFDEDFYGSDQFNDDEFDAAGFDEMTMDE